MADHGQLIAEFASVTGTDTERAKFYLESSGWKLEVALASFYDEDDGDVDNSPQQNTPSGGKMSSQPAASQAPSSRGAGSASRFATLASMQQEEDSGSDSEEGQTFYAGGSEHSGELIMGPKKKKASDIIDNMFKSAKEHGAEVVEPGASADNGKRKPIFRGAGYRLGDENEGSSQVVSGQPIIDQPRQVEITLKLWKDGFSVGDGEVRNYADPTNKDFLDSIHRGEVPRELIRMARGGEVNLNMEDHRDEDFVKPKVKAKAFSGEGHKLGSPAPTVTSQPPPSAAQSQHSETAARNSVSVDQSKPVTSLQIRLADGTRMVAKFNHSHTISDIRNYIITAHPQYSGRNFVLMTTFPNKELTQENETLEQAKLLNAVLVQRVK